MISIEFENNDNQENKQFNELNDKVDNNLDSSLSSTIDLDPTNINVNAKSHQTIKTATKAYENLKFLNSRESRTIRLLSEYLHPEQYLKKYNIKNTIVFFGSARSISSIDYKNRRNILLQKLGNAKDEKEQNKLTIELKNLERLEFTTKYYDEGVKLSYKLAEWSKTLNYNERFYICTGGGPGMMEAANKGAYLADSPTIGLNITLPFEQIPNQFITPELNFQFHYFFMRKFWFVYQAKAIIVMPGGYGTIDELLEVLTLDQTNILDKKMPIILYGEEFWRKTIDFEYLAEIGMINNEDLDLFHYANDVNTAFNIITNSLKELLHND